jgi:hypothetical protein
LFEKVTALIEQEGERIGSKPVKVTPTSTSRLIARIGDIAAAAVEPHGSRRSPPMWFA